MSDSTEFRIADDKIVSVVLDEYKILWSYYQTIVKEWTSFIDAYLKVVTIPAGLLAVLLTQGHEKLKVDAQVFRTCIAAGLGMLSTIGFGIFIGYCKECENGNRYEAALAKIREWFRSKHVELHNVLIIDSLRLSRTRIPGGIKFWRGLSMILLNSIIASIGIHVLANQKTAVWLILLFPTIVLTHCLLFKCIVRKPRSGGTP